MPKLFFVFVMLFSVTSCASNQKPTALTSKQVMAVAEHKQMEPIQQNQYIEVQGHRGARGRYPENTLIGLDYALQVGADVLEFDLGVTKDGVVVLAHDPYINPEICVDKNGQKLKDKIPLRSLSYSEVKMFDCGTLPHPRFPMQKKVKSHIPTLDDVFELVKKSALPNSQTVLFNIETKITPENPELFVSPKEFAEKVLTIVNKHKMLNRTTLQSFDYRTLEEARKLDPHLSIAPLIEKKFSIPLSVAKKLDAQLVSPNQYLINKATVQQTHRAGIRVIPWTANTEKEWQRLVDMGITSIITDYPEECIQFLTQKGFRQLKK